MISFVFDFLKINAWHFDCQKRTVYGQNQTRNVCDMNESWWKEHTLDQGWDRDFNQRFIARLKGGDGITWYPRKEWRKDTRLESGASTDDLSFFFLLNRSFFEGTVSVQCESSWSRSCCCPASTQCRTCLSSKESYSDEEVFCFFSCSSCSFRVLWFLWFHPLLHLCLSREIQSWTSFLPIFFIRKRIVSCLRFIWWVVSIQGLIQIYLQRFLNTLIATLTH